MPRTHQIVYISYARRPMSDEELIDLCHRSAEKNKKDGITGFLTFDGKAFLQLVEGKEPVVTALFERIKRDRRHHSIRVLFEEEGPRLLPNWHMHYEHFFRTDKTIKEILENVAEDESLVISGEQIKGIIGKLRFLESA